MATIQSCFTATTHKARMRVRKCYTFVHTYIHDMFKVQLKNYFTIFSIDCETVVDGFLQLQCTGMCPRAPLLDTVELFLRCSCEVSLS